MKLCTFCVRTFYKTATFPFQPMDVTKPKLEKLPNKNVFEMESEPVNARKHLQYIAGFSGKQNLRSLNKYFIILCSKNST